MPVATVLLDRATIVTTTLYRALPSSLPQTTQSPERPVPVSAIVGGAAAGALLAILVTVGWVWWGRAIDQAAAVQRIEAATRHNTRRNAGGISRPRPHTRHRSAHGYSAEKQVKFVGGQLQATLQMPPPAATRKTRRHSRMRVSTAAFPSRIGPELLKPAPPAGVHMNENHGRRSDADIEKNEREEERSESHSSHSLLSPKAENNVKSRWSWTSSLDFLFSRSGRADRRGGASQEETDGQSSRAEPLGIAL